MNKILVVGYKGKMGGLVYEKLKSLGYDVVGIDKTDNLQLQAKADLVIDFSVPDFTLTIVEWCLKTKTPLIVGTTGHTADQIEILKNFAVGLPILKAGNFSMGIFGLKQCLSKLKKLNPDSITIYETHHKNKKDSPSGTALEIAKMIKDIYGQTASVLSERGGKEVGEHIVNLYFNNEIVSVSHKAYSRECFADGVIKATEFMLKNNSNKFYKFSDIF